ncbi:MAG: ATP-binding cassette domain-containing protein [Candidatus Saccharimonas sp.]|nr:ATP-binding cassette domain-containing protein [Planctomycetaceae bacterium]
MKTSPLPAQPSTAPVLELRRISQSFGTQAVLRDVTVTIQRGETLVLIGESGCGKSVTTKLLAGLLDPTSGEVLWEGRPVKGRSSRELRRDRLRFGYLFQGAALFDSMNVYENICFGLRENTDLKQPQIHEIVHERLREVGLAANVAEKRPADLSGGMKKRVGLARALAMSPDVIFYDEPTTGLDPVMSDVINELILQTQSQRNVTSVVVTHDMQTVRRVADRVVMLYPLARVAPEQPQVIFEGTPDEAFASADPRVGCFVRGEAGARLKEMAAA